MHSTKPLVREPTCFEGEITIEKLKRFISPGTYQMPADLLQAVGST